MDNLKKTRLWILCGIPGSGKSTWIQNHINYFSDSCAVISRDAIRFSKVTDVDNYFSKEKEVWADYVKAAKDSLKENKDTILDATHINESSRGKILRALKEDIKDVEVNAIMINVSLSVALERNAGREGMALVPESAIKRMYSQLTKPSLEEGFNHIYIYSEKNGKIKYQIIE